MQQSLLGVLVAVLVILSIAAPVLAAPYGNPITFNVSVAGDVPPSGSSNVTINGNEVGRINFPSGTGTFTLAAGQDIPLDAVIAVDPITVGGKTYTFSTNTISLTLVPRVCELVNGVCNELTHKQVADTCAICLVVGPAAHGQIACTDTTDLGAEECAIVGPAAHNLLACTDTTDLRPEVCGICNAVGPTAAHNPISCTDTTDLRAERCNECGANGDGFVDPATVGHNPSCSQIGGLLLGRKQCPTCPGIGVHGQKLCDDV